MERTSLHSLFVVFFCSRIPCACFFVWLLISGACLPTRSHTVLPFGVDELYGCGLVSARIGSLVVRSCIRVSVTQRTVIVFVDVKSMWDTTRV